MSPKSAPVVALPVVSSSPTAMPAPWARGLPLEPLPPLDRIVPAHVAYVRSVLARFSVAPGPWRDDLAQDILLEAHRSRGSRLDARALLFGIARHLVSRWRARRHAERAALAQLPAEEPVTDWSAEDDWRDRERREAVRGAIADLPDSLREVFVRCEIQHVAMSEVARDLGILVNTGYTRLHLARARFLESLQRSLARRRVKGEELL